MKYHIVQLGCQMNISDGERVQKVLEDVGYVHTDNPESANLIGVIACSVRQKGIDKVYSMVNTWNKWKNNRNLITFVSGCVLPSDKEKFLKLFDMVFTMSQLPELPEMINHYGIVTPAGLMGNENIQVEQEFTDNSPQLGGFRINEAQIPSSSTLVEKKPEDIKEHDEKSSTAKPVKAESRPRSTKKKKKKNGSKRQFKRKSDF